MKYAYTTLTKSALAPLLNERRRLEVQVGVVNAALAALGKSRTAGRKRTISAAGADRSPRHNDYAGHGSGRPRRSGLAQDPEAHMERLRDLTNNQ